MTKKNTKKELHDSLRLNSLARLIFVIHDSLLAALYESIMNRRRYHRPHSTRRLGLQSALPAGEPPPPYPPLPLLLLLLPSKRNKRILVTPEEKATKSLVNDIYKLPSQLDRQVSLRHLAATAFHRRPTSSFILVLHPT